MDMASRFQILDKAVCISVVVMPQTILPLSATDTPQSEEKHTRCDLFYGGECDKPTWSGEI